MKINPSPKRFLLFAALGFLLPNLIFFASIRSTAESTQIASTYKLVFSQHSLSSSSGVSAKYKVEDTIKAGSAGEESQIGGKYRVTNTLNNVSLFANNGLAIGQGTNMLIRWTGSNVPSGSQGFLIKRSPANPILDYQSITPEPVSECSFTDRGLEPGTYFYLVYYVDIGGQIHPWTSSFYGTILEPAGSGQWFNYE